MRHDGIFWLLTTKPLDSIRQVFNHWLKVRGCDSYSLRFHFHPLPIRPFLLIECPHRHIPPKRLTSDERLPRVWQAHEKRFTLSSLDRILLRYCCPITFKKRHLWTSRLRPFARLQFGQRGFDHHIGHDGECTQWGAFPCSHQMLLGFRRGGHVDYPQTANLAPSCPAE